MDDVVVKDVVLDKKLDSYNSEENNFKASRELTVEITLNEYRELVRSNAVKEEAINKANSDKYERESENKSLMQQIEALKAENYELKKALDDAIKEKDANKTMEDK